MTNYSNSPSQIHPNNNSNNNTMNHQSDTNISFDALIVGAGFGGIYELHSLRAMGLSTLLIDKASGVGGTWYWNRYPGAASDTESYLFRYSWDKELLQSYPWPNHYLTQEEVLAYLEHVVEKYALGQDIKLDTELVEARWDQPGRVWCVKLRETSSSSTEKGGTVVGREYELRVRYLVTALGLLSNPVYPDIPGLSEFRGVTAHTAAWAPDIEFKDKRVGVIGCGSTGIQVVTELAKSVKSLVSFQRNPQYTVPNGNGPVSAEYRESVNENYDKIWAKVWDSATAFGVHESTVPFASVSPAERERVFEELWKQGNGFRFMFGGFSDLTSNKEANDAACEFIKRKIAQIVKDPEKARKLMPKEAYARRPCCDGGYYQVFNQENVSIVHLGETPIETIVPEGVRTSDGTVHELDLLVFATGFDAVEGSYNRLNIQGRTGETLKEHWEAQGPTSFMGVSVAGFPNFFMTLGPQGPFTNNPPCIERQVLLHKALIHHAEKVKQKVGKVPKVTPEAESAWVQHCEQLAEGSLFKETASWIFGNNVSGKKIALRFYFGGIKKYQEEVEHLAQGGYKPYTLV